VQMFVALPFIFYGGTRWCRYLWHCPLFYMGALGGADGCGTALYFIWGHAVVQMIVALPFKHWGRGFDFRWCQLIFHCYNPSGRTTALVSTEHLIEISTRDIFRGCKGGRCSRLTTLPPSNHSFFTSRNLNLLELSVTVQACKGIAVRHFILQ
jgi:hypothetical protein